jgi:hypothetical protein
MKYRTRAIGGTLKIIAKPGRGNTRRMPAALAPTLPPLGDR